MKLVRMMTMMTLMTAGMAACVDGAPDAGEDEAATPAALPTAALAETQAAVTAAELENATPVASTEVARVRLFYGDLVYYAPAQQEPADVSGAPGSGLRSIVAAEISRPDSAGQVRGLAASRSPLDEYLTTTPASAPVPRALLESEAPGPVRDRALQRPQVERLTAPVAGLPQAQLTSQTVALGSVSDWCSGGTSASFAADVCPRDVWDVNFCHNGTWHSVTDDVGSSNKKRNSRSRTLACGANGRVRHYYKSGGIWYKPIDETIPSNQLWRWTKWGNWALARAITHSRTGSGFVRGASHFNVPF